ncbi:plasminogen-like [Branchiostoma floridae x Branchiostoma belcheri]
MAAIGLPKIPDVPLPSPTSANTPTPVLTTAQDGDCKVGYGDTYRGTVSVTYSGKTCQRWDRQTPHSHDRTPANHPSSGLDQNYCRNPDGASSVWCYTTDPGTRTEFCEVPFCKEPFGFVRWGRQTPHSHDRTPANYPAFGLEQNYCRNPDGISTLWCYTTDPGTRWDYCDVPLCNPPFAQTEDCKTGDGRFYRGTVAVTRTGRTCQRWDSQTPHSHSRTPSNYPASGLDQNYCRNPDGEDTLWCYTTDSGKRWDYCYAPTCYVPFGDECLVGPNSRKNCGWGGIDVYTCRQRGCCFDSSISGTSWCFYSSRH